MILTIIGVVLLLIPFLLIKKFEDRKKGFVYILVFVILFHLLLAIITQFLHIFNYWLILIVNFLVCGIVLFKVNLKSIYPELKAIRLDWALVAIVVIGAICLSFVHFNYSGEYSTATPGYKQAENLDYKYPYFSDEWYSVALINYSISSGGLPMASSLVPGTFLNLEFPFHSFLSGIFMLLHLNPLEFYSVLTIFFGILVCGLVYLFLISNKVSKLSAAVASLAVLYIPSAANLPGLWNLIPINLGVICFLLGLFFIAENNRKMILLSGFITFMFYPPLAIFYALAVFIRIFSIKEMVLRDKIKQAVYYFILAIGVAVIISLAYLIFKGSYSGFFGHLISRLFYPSFTMDYIPRYSIYYVIPIWVLILGVFGFVEGLRDRKWLVGIVSLGLVYWFFYSFVTFRIIIEYQRVVFLTSILIVLLAGFGIDWIARYVEGKRIGRNWIEFVLILAIIAFFILSFSYTQANDWKKLKAVGPDGKEVMPAAPANIYLTSEDIRLFAEIRNKTFLSLPWKGTVIGVYTGNRAACIKPGTMSYNPNLFNEFMQTDCNGKGKIVLSKKIDYVYSPELNCSGFLYVGRSSEGLYLYKTR